MGALAEAIAADTEAYRLCQARHRAAVEAYDSARRTINSEETP